MCGITYQGDDSESVWVCCDSCELWLDFNPLTTNDDYSHRNSAACYQLAQSVLKIGSGLAERVGQGEVSGCTALGDSAWWQVDHEYQYMVMNLISKVQG